MSTINRRDFMKRSGAVTAAAVATSTLIQSSAHAATVLKPIGKTSLKTTYLGIGTGTKAWNGSSAQNRQGREAFVNTLEQAYDRGLRYYDLADMYGAHDYMRDALKRNVKREEVMMLTKTVAREPEKLKADLDRFQKEINTDYFDIVLLHCMTKGDWNQDLAACMDVLSEAKQQGRVKAVGVSCHNLDAMKTASQIPWVDVMLNRINPYGVKMDGTPEEVLEVLETAHANGKGMLGMKILGEGEIADKRRESLKFVMGLACIDVITIGFMNDKEIEDIFSLMDEVQAELA